MRNNARAAHAAAWLLGGATVAVSGSAMAQTIPACPTTSNTVYVSGSSAFKPVLQAVANVLGTAVNIVYTSPGSCEGLDFVVENSMDAATTRTLFVPGAAAGTCSTPAGATIDVGFSDVYPTTCRATFDPNLPALGTGFSDFLGPVQAMTFAVPSNSMATMISAEAAYMVFGFNATPMSNAVGTWTNSSDIFVRFYDSGTLEMLATAINLPGSKWVNATNKSSANTVGGTGPMQTALINRGGMTGHANSTIGVVSTSGLEAATATTLGVSPLAFQGVGQTCSYYPDSTSSAVDKINVRQGRYQVWGPEHMVTNVDGSGKPVGENTNTAAVQTLINALTSTSQAPAAASASDAGAGDGGVTTLGETEVGQIIAAISPATVGFIPTCAMQVSRTAEIGAEASYAPPAACSCAYEIATGAPIAGHTCTPCGAADAGTACSGATPACHFGYCEAE